MSENEGTGEKTLEWEPINAHWMEASCLGAKYRAGRVSPTNSEAYYLVVEFGGIHWSEHVGGIETAKARAQTHANELRSIAAQATANAQEEVERLKAESARWEQTYHEQVSYWKTVGNEIAAAKDAELASLRKELEEKTALLDLRKQQTEQERKTLGASLEENASLRQCAEQLAVAMKMHENRGWPLGIEMKESLAAYNQLIKPKPGA